MMLTQYLNSKLRRGSSGWFQVFRFLLYSLIHTSISVSLDSDTELYPWTQKLTYYYPSVDEKMKDILSPDCSRKLSILQDGLIQLPSSNATINVASMPVKNEIMEWWKSIQKPNQMRVDPNLCESVYTKRKPIFNGTGCQLKGYMHPSAPRCQNKYLKYVCDQSQIPIDESNGNAFVLPESDHSKTLLPPQPWLLTARNSFVSMCGTISTDCGLIHTLSNCQGTSLKYIGNLFFNKCASAQMNNMDMKAEFPSKSGTCIPGTPYSDEFDFHDKVFVVAETDDTHVYHLHLEIFPRIMYHLDFLLDHPEIRIMIGCDTKKNPKMTDVGLSHMLLGIKPLMALAGLSMDRLIIHRHVFAREIYFPMEGGCQDPVYNTWQILTMRHRFMAALNMTEMSDEILFQSKNSDSVSSTGSGSSSGSARISRDSNNSSNSSSRLHIETDMPHDGARLLTSDYNSNLNSSLGDEIHTNPVLFQSSMLIGNSRPVMLLMKRSTGAKHTRNSEDLVRQWSESFTDRLVGALRSQFPEYNLRVYSDKDEKLMTSHASQIRLFAGADILIGMHGAGLSNQVYMKANSAVVELCPYPNDGRCLLGGGPFSRIAAVMSHNYMIHHPPHKEFKWILKDRSSEFDINRFVTHIHSFLQSIKNKPKQ